MGWGYSVYFSSLEMEREGLKAGDKVMVGIHKLEEKDEKEEVIE